MVSFIGLFCKRDLSFLNTITPDRAPDIILAIQRETCHSLMFITLLSLSYVYLLCLCYVYHSLVTLLCLTCHSLMFITLFLSLSETCHSLMFVTLLCSMHSPHLNQMTKNHNKLHDNQSKHDMGWLR